MAWVFGGVICLSEQWKSVFKKCVSLFFTIPFGDAILALNITHFTLAFLEQQQKSTFGPLKTQKQTTQCYNRKALLHCKTSVRKKIVWFT